MHFAMHWMLEVDPLMLFSKELLFVYKIHPLAKR